MAKFYVNSLERSEKVDVKNYYTAWKFMLYLVLCAISCFLDQFSKNNEILKPRTQGVIDHLASSTTITLIIDLTIPLIQVLY